MAAIDSHLAMEQRAAGDCHPTLCGDDCEDDNHGDHTGHDECVVNAEEEGLPNNSERPVDALAVKKYH